MFGHDKTDDQTNGQVMTPTEPVQTDSDDNTELTLPAPDAAVADDATTLDDASMSDASAAATADDESVAEETAEADTAPETTDEPVEALADEAPAEDTEALEAATASVGSISSMGGSSDLASLKKATLKELSPLVSHLDQPPEEKLNTIMKIYDATKDETLLKAAHDAAISLSDDTARAKALLDLIQKIDEAEK